MQTIKKRSTDHEKGKDGYTCTTTIQTIVLLSCEQCTLRNNNTQFMHEFQTTSFIQIMHVRHTILTNIYFLCSGLSCYEDELAI